MVLVAAVSQAGCRPGGGDAAGRAKTPAAKVLPAMGVKAKAAKAGPRPPMAYERMWTLARPFLGDPLKDGFRASIKVIGGDRLKLKTNSPTRRVIHIKEVEGGVSVSGDAGFRNPRLHPLRKTGASRFDEGVLKVMRAREVIRARGSKSGIVAEMSIVTHGRLIGVFVEAYPPTPGGHGLFIFDKSGKLLD